MSTEDQALPYGERTSILERVEAFYLMLLRAAVLLVATLVLLWAAWLSVSAVYKFSQSPDSVVEATASVKASELEEQLASKPQPRQNAAVPAEVADTQRTFYQNFVSRYYNLYRTKFESFRRVEDKQLSKDEFDDSYIHSAKRLQGVATGDLNFSDDQKLLNGLYSTMMEAAALPNVTAKLRGYKTAKKQKVSQRVQRFRTESRRGWDSLSSSCAGWYESPIGCAVTRYVQVPYYETVSSLALPAGLVAPPGIFSMMQDRYLSLLSDRQQAAAQKARADRDAIAAGHLQGWGQISLMLWVLGAFLLLMFFFLLIAIERHQRRMPKAQ